MSLGVSCVLLQVIADGVFISGSSVKTDEAAITGESDNVAKDVANDPFMLSGTSMAAGTCNMLVTAVGVRSTQVCCVCVLAGSCNSLSDGLLHACPVKGVAHTLVVTTIG